MNFNRKKEEDSDLDLEEDFSLLDPPVIDEFYWRVKVYATEKVYLSYDFDEIELAKAFIKEIVDGTGWYSSNDGLSGFYREKIAIIETSRYRRN